MRSIDETTDSTSFRYVPELRTHLKAHDGQLATMGADADAGLTIALRDTYAKVLYLPLLGRNIMVQLG